MASASSPRTSASAIDDTHLAARVALVDQHIRLENAHDLPGVLATFGASARYDDEPWNEHYTGRDGVQRFYQHRVRAGLRAAGLPLHRGDA